MKNITALLILTIMSSGAFAQAIPACKDRNGNTLSGTVDQLRQVINSNANRPEVMVTGTVTSLLPDDNSGLPHQKYYISAGGQVNVEIVSNLDFDRIPLQVGQTVTVCGEYINAQGQPMVHWTHFDPHGGHPNGFTLLNGHVYGEEQTATTGEEER